MPARQSVSNSTPSRLPQAVLVFSAALFLHALACQSLLSDQSVAQAIFSIDLWSRIVSLLGGRVTQLPSGALVAEVAFVPVLLADIAIAIVCCIAGALFIARRVDRPFTAALADWMLFGWLWWFLPGIWEALQWLQIGPLTQFLRTTPQFWHAAAIGGWLATLFTLAQRPIASRDERAPIADNYRLPFAVWLAMFVYIVVFTAMNWRLYDNLLVPHGDSAMYEEHLWNLLHGKGFRSYLDQGLFLGEHIQVIHLAIIPLGYVLWPDHRLLEFWQSVAIASTAIPLFWIARRHTNSVQAAKLIAIACLLYMPLQFLDIAIDLKTFRPTALAIPVLLAAIDQVERGRLKTAALLAVIALSAQEDFAILLACLGAWIFVFPRAASDRKDATKVRVFGGLMAVLMTAYLFVVVLYVLPWFRGGEHIHYVRYFGDLGSSPSELAQNAIERPGRVLSTWFSQRTAIYALSLLMPLGFLPLLSPTRLAIALPMFAILSLFEFTTGPVIPFHHFHAPLIPIILWAAAAGTARLTTGYRLPSTGAGPMSPTRKQGAVPNPQSAIRNPQWNLWPSRFVFACALASGLFFSLSPLGLAFWDPGSQWNWQSLYRSQGRAARFAHILPGIPIDSRVVSTDFVHPRFTHFARSYDYSHYKRKVSGDDQTVPDDTDFIVIDTQHRYSDIHSPQEVPEFRDHPEQWELLPDTTDGYFLVFKRKESGQ